MIERTLENRSKNIGLKVNAKIEVLPMVPIHQVNTDVTGRFSVDCCLQRQSGLFACNRYSFLRKALLFCFFVVFFLFLFFLKL